MKQKNHYYLLCIVAALLFTACNNGIEKTGSKLSSEDSLKIAFYDNFLDTTKDYKSIDSRKDIPVEFALADESISEYERISKNGSLIDIQKLVSTQYVRFEILPLKKWIDEIVAKSDANNFRIHLGSYSDSFTTRYSYQLEHKGKITIFIYPYKNDEHAKYLKEFNVNEERINPFNFGHIYP